MAQYVRVPKCRMAQHMRVPKRVTNYHKVMVILILVAVILLVQSEYFRNISSAFRGGALAIQKCPIPARFHLSAEPELYRKWKDADVYLVAGGYNLFPGRAAFNPTLIGGCCKDKIFRRGSDPTLQVTPIMNRTFADVLYRSSLCEKRREKLAGLVRERVEAAGFIFKASGYCGGHGYPTMKNHKGRGEWAKCGKECEGSKIMLSFERFQEGHHYLSEKLFLPLEYGAVPAYHGNGHSILDMLTANRKSFIDRSEFSSDEAFADRIVYLLRHPEELQKMQQEPVFYNAEMARKRALFMVRVENTTEEWNPELYRAFRESEKFKKFINGVNVTYRYYGVNPVRIVKHILNIKSLVTVRDPDTCVDIEVNGCCP